MAKINMKIKNTPIGTLDQELVKSCMQKKGFSTLEETLIYYFRKGWDFSEDDNLDECLRKAQREVEIYDFESIAELIEIKMRKEMRPDNEICKNCKMYDKQFCCYKLCRVNPFEKGCEGWKSINSIDTPINIEFIEPNSRCNDKNDFSSQKSDNIISFTGYDKETPSIDEVKKMIEEIQNKK